MSNKQIEERIALLYLVLQYCSERTKTFTAGERICVNQERFQWMHILDDETAFPRPVAPHLENKLKDVARLAQLHNFKPYYDDPFKDKSEILLQN